MLTAQALQPSSEMPQDIRWMNAATAALAVVAVLLVLAAGFTVLSRQPYFVIHKLSIDGEMQRNNLATVRANVVPRVEGSFFMVESFRGLWSVGAADAPDHEHERHGQQGSGRGDDLGARRAGVGGCGVLQGGDLPLRLRLHVELRRQLVDGVGELLSLGGDLRLELLGRARVTHGVLP